MTTAEENYKRLRDELNKRLEANKQLAAIADKIAKGKADFNDTSKYSHIVSQIMGDVISENIGSINVPLGKELVCKELLREHYDRINGVLGEVQASVDDKLGIHLNPKKAPFPTERVDKAAHSLEDPTVPIETIERRAKSVTENIAESMHDDYIKENASWREQAGLDCYLVRDAGGGCCPWCQVLEGKYPYATAPDDVFRRHDNCHCSVTYECGKKRQDVWSKRTWEEPEDKLAARKELEEQSRAKVNSRKQAKELEQKLLDKSAKGAILKGEYNEEDIIRAITQEGTNFVTKDPNDPESLFGEFVELVPADERYYDIKAHGSPEAVKLFGSVVDAQTLARVILLRADYTGKPIRLLCCETGKMQNGTCFAKQLSALLGVDVIAPTEEYKVSITGNVKIESDTGVKGIMETFESKKR